MERSYLICLLIGKYSALEPNISGFDMQIKVDNYLLDSKLTPIGTEPTDLQLMQELLAETMIGVMGKGINRHTRRKMGIKKTQ